MRISALILLALSVSMDNFAVGLGLGMSRPTRMARLALTFGACQLLMPLLGWLGGSQVAFLFRGHERWPLFASLAFVGWRMVRSARESVKAQQTGSLTPETILGLALATSLDSLVVGFGLAMTQVHILEASAVFGAVGAILSSAGMLCGKGLGQTLGRHSRLAGGLTLMMIGIRALVVR